MFDFIKNKNKGLTLVELIITVAVLAITSSLLVGSYVNMMESQRMKADLATLGIIDTSLQQIMLSDEVFNEIYPEHEEDESKKLQYIYDDNKISLTFHVKPNSNAKGTVKLSETTLNNRDDLKLKKDCFNKLYTYLTEYVDDEITLTSATYREGYYKVEIAFNMASEAKGKALNNDSVIVTNSGDSGLLND